MTRLKVLNLYAGIGGNRKLWPDDEVEVTAIEYNEEIAKIYQDFFPEDKVIVGDAHKYLLEHYKEFDFIWSSPPCPTHSRMRLLCNEQEGKTTPYPDMKLYEEIIFLTHWFKGKWVVENVISYYSPLTNEKIKLPFIVGNHYYWSNFHILNKKENARQLIRISQKDSILLKSNKYNINLDKYNIQNSLKNKILDNMVEPKTGLHIFNCAYKEKQVTLI